MRTLHFGLRVADLERSLAFYTAVGYEVVGSVPETAFGRLTMLKLPDDDFVTIELAHDPTNDGADPGAGLNHFVIKVESIHATITELAEPFGISLTGSSPDTRLASSSTRSMIWRS